MTLFEDREVESLYLRQTKNTLRAKVVPPLITAFALVLAIAVTAYRGVPAAMVNTACILPAALAGFAAAGAQVRLPRVQYQLRAATLGFAVLTATVVFVVTSLSNQFHGFGPTASLGLLWVCQKVLVISDVVAARVLVVVVPFNLLVLLLCVGWGISRLFDEDFMGGYVSLAAIAHTFLELVTAVLASSGVLLWVAIRNELASRTAFYWSRVVNANVKTLDAEANPFHEHRLLEWVSRSGNVQEMIRLSTNRQHRQRLFWELDGATLKLEEKIAAGGGGVVWNAKYDGKIVAAKQLYAGTCTGSKQLVELAAEVAVLAQLSHVNIVRFLGLCRHAGEAQSADSVYLPLFIVQEFCATNLRVVLTTTLPAMPHAEWQSEVNRIALEVSSGMAYLHERKVVHRDLKPENILLTQQRIVRIADFGVSLQSFDGTAASDKGGGTLAYMSPEALCNRFGLEHATREDKVDGMKSDVYAFGVILCELVYSDSDAQVADTLAENAVSNRKLATTLRGSDHINFEPQWAFPPLRNKDEVSALPCSELSRQCCAYCPSDRPSFKGLRGMLTRWPEPIHDVSQQMSSDAGQRTKCRSLPAQSTEMHALSAHPLPRQARLSTASIGSAVGVEAQEHRQRLVELCAFSCWSRHKLLFADRNTERRFVSFLHSDAFFRHFRWPFAVLTALPVVCVVLMLFTMEEMQYSVYRLACTALFGAAAMFCWVPRFRRFSTMTLAILGFVAVAVQCAMVWMQLFTPPTMLTNSSSVVCVCNISLTGQCTMMCRRNIFEIVLVTLLLPLLQDLTIPVTLLVLGLPFYLYVWIFGLCAISWIGTVAGGFCVWWDYVVELALPDFWLVVLPGVALYPICAMTAIAGETTRRKMFLQLCNLRSQEINLLEHATFRGYREALMENWRFLAETPGNSDKSRSGHVVTAATV